MSVDLRESERTAVRLRNRAQAEGRLVDNPNDSDLRSIHARQPGVRPTMYGNYVAESEPTSRSATFTKNSVDDQFGDEESRLLAQCEEVLSCHRSISVDRIVGNSESTKTVRLLIPEQFAHIAYGGRNLFYALRTPVEEPTYHAARRSRGWEVRSIQR